MKNANQFFGASNGSENLYRYSFTKFIYTDGVKAMAQECKAYWLIELIISHQVNAEVNKEPFQVWHLSRVKDSLFKILPQMVMTTGLLSSKSHSAIFRMTWPPSGS